MNDREYAWVYLIYAFNKLKKRLVYVIIILKFLFSRNNSQCDLNVLKRFGLKKRIGESFDRKTLNNVNNEISVTLFL